MKSNRKTNAISQARPATQEVTGIAITPSREHRRTIKLSTLILVAVAMFLMGTVYGAASAENGTGLAEIVKFGKAPAYETTATPKQTAALPVTNPGNM